MAKPTPKADPLAGLTDILRDLFSTLSAPPPKMKAPKKMAASEPEEDDDEDEDEDDADELDEDDEDDADDKGEWDE